MKRLYLRASSKGGKTIEIYRQMVLLDQFERVHRLALPSTFSLDDR